MANLKPKYQFKIDVKKEIKKGMDIADMQDMAIKYKGVDGEHISEIIKELNLNNAVNEALSAENKKANLVYQEIDSMFIKHYPDIAIYEQENNITFCEYRNGVYEMLSTQEIELMVDEFFILNELHQHRTSTRNIKDTVARISRSHTVKNKRRFTDSIIENQTYLCNMIDGLLNPVTEEITPHRKDYYSLSQINQTLNAEQTMDIFKEKFLKNLEKASKGFSDMLQEVAGYVLFDKGNSLEKFIVFYGPTARNGKNTFTKVLTGLLGKRYVSHLPLNTLCTPSAHAMRGIVGKKLNISDEISGEHVKAGNLTSLTGRGVININPKGKDDFSYQPVCSFILCCNTQPKFMEDIGMNARMLIIPFYHHMKEEDRIENFPELVLEKEGGAILKWALEGYQRLMKRGKFEMSEESKKLLKQNNENNNNIVNFLSNHTIVTGDLTGPIVKKTELWEHFKSFCIDENVRYVPKKTEFYQSIESYGMKHGTIEESRDANDRGYVGLLIPTGYSDIETLRKEYKEMLEQKKKDETTLDIAQQLLDNNQF